MLLPGTKMPSPAYGRIRQESEMQDEEAEEAASSKTPLVPPHPPHTPTEMPIGGPKPPMVALKLVVLIAVMLQNTAYALARRYSRGHLRETYSTSSVLMVMEASKMVLSMGMIVYAGAPSDVPSGSARYKYYFLLRHSQKMMVPAVVYLVMNILGFVVKKHGHSARARTHAWACGHPPLQTPARPPARPLRATGPPCCDRREKGECPGRHPRRYIRLQPPLHKVTGWLRYARSTHAARIPSRG